MAYTKLFDQSGTVSNQLCSGLSTRKWCDGVGLADIHTPKFNKGEGEALTYGVSNNEDRVL